MADWTFKLFFAKKEEQWAYLKANRLEAYSVFNEDPEDSYALDALCMHYLYQEQEKRNILI